MDAADNIISTDSLCSYCREALREAWVFEVGTETGLPGQIDGEDIEQFLKPSKNCRLCRFFRKSFESCMFGLDGVTDHCEEENSFRLHKWMERRMERTKVITFPSRSSIDGSACSG